jgi:putative addiction module killer protein
MGYTLSVRVLETRQYREWIDALKDSVGRARILMRVDRLIHGNPGLHRNLTHGISELKVDSGPGYRVYYSKRGDTLLILLVAGNKKSQDSDIKAAIQISNGITEPL